MGVYINASWLFATFCVFFWLQNRLTKFSQPLIPFVDGGLRASVLPTEADDGELPVGFGSKYGLAELPVAKNLAFNPRLTTPVANVSSL